MNKVKKLVYGFGLNDSNYKVYLDKKRCSFYTAWTHMLERCYSDKYQSRNPSYLGCSVSEEWRSFMSFRDWMMEQEWQGRHLDKDIISPGNKVYSQYKCVFVPPHINTLLNSHAGDRGAFPQGVSFHKQSNRFKSDVSISGKKRFIGLFDSAEEASEAYIVAKVEHVINTAEQQDDARIREGLKRHAASMMKGLI
jgi:hypothetical protein